MNKLCVLVRLDGLTPAQQAVQAGHAVAEWLLAYPDFGWINTTLIYTQVPFESDILAYSSLFKLKGIRHVLYQDTDLGENFTALATADKGAFTHTKRLPLWGKQLSD